MLKEIFKYERFVMLTPLPHFRPIVALLLAMSAIWVVPSSWAQSVIPAPRITSPITVLEAPSSGSTPVGQLSPSESATLLESVPYWYHVRLRDGTSGYVSKVSTELVPVVEAASVTIRLGSWNTKKLGHGTSKDFQGMAQIIEGNFDIVAIVEVMQNEGSHPGYDTLLSTLGTGWSGMVTDDPRPNTAAGHAEFYAIMYRTNAIRPCTDWASLIYHHDNDGSENGTGPDHFSREPAFGCFQSPATGSTVGVDFILAAYHARWAGGKSKRIAEVSHIGQVFASMAAARTGEHDLFIAGDFNLVPEDLRHVVSVPVDTQGTGSTLNSSGGLTTNLYDHILVHDHVATQERLGPPQVIDVIGAASSPREFYRTLSDHLPVLMQLRVSGPDDD